MIRQRPTQGASHLDFLGESEGSLPPPHDSFPDAVEARNDFLPCQETSYTAITLNPELSFTRREESFPVPLKYIDVSRTTPTTLDVKQEKRIDDYWNIDGSRDLSDYWTGFTQFFFEEIPPNGYMWSGERLTRKQLTSREDHLWLEHWNKMGKNAKLKEKQKWSPEKLHLDNARKLRGIYFIDPEDKEFKETIKNVRRIVGVVHPTKTKQILLVFWKLVNLQDCVWENHFRIIMKTMLQEEGTIHCSIIIWFTSLFLCLKL